MPYELHVNFMPYELHAKFHANHNEELAYLSSALGLFASRLPKILHRYIYYELHVYEVYMNFMQISMQIKL